MVTFNAGELVATLRLQGLDEFERGVDRAGRRLGDAGSKADVLRSAGAAAFRTVAAATTTAATAGGVFLASLFKTGLGYNKLQQTSRAALSSIVGGTEQANAQMDKLDAFARKSPFSKSVFISAQQQLLGFGMEAKKVIPTLDAVQQAVAATGGSSQKLSEITFVLAQIQAAGKITGQDLIQLGQRGIDAASLIGSQMGKTGAQIRSDITAGALSAEDALDALTKGMSEKFEGASANVKATIAGTVDRIRAASREIGAALAEPFVSQQGGGHFVTWGNQVADIMRAVLQQTTPVVNMLTARAMPAFAGLTKALDSAQVSVSAWDSSRLDRFLSNLGPYVPLITAFATAWATVGLRAVPVLGALLSGVNPLVAAVLALSATSPELRAAGRDVFEALSPLIPVAADLAQLLADGLTGAVGGAATVVTGLARAATPLVSLISSIPTPVLAAVAGFVLLQRTLKPMKGGLEVLGTGFKVLQERIAVQAALGAMEGNTSRLAGTFGVAGSAARGFGNSLKAAFLSNPAGLAILAISTAVGLVTAAFAASEQSTEDHRRLVVRLRDAYLETSGAIDQAREAVVRSNLDNSDAAKYAETLGIAYETVVAAANGSAEAYDEITAASARFREEQGKDLGTSNYDRLLDVIDAQIDAHDDAVEAAKAYRDAQREAAAAMSDAERSNSRLNDALAIARDTSKDATERLSALRQAIDELRGGPINAAEATARLNEANLNLSETLAKTNDEGKKLWSTVLDGAGALDTTSRAGLELHDQMLRASDGMNGAAQSAYDLAIKAGDDLPVAQQKARDAAEGWITSMRDTLLQADLTQEQIDGLFGTYLAAPETVATLITDNGTISSTQQSILNLSERIRSTPDKTVTISEPFSPAIMKQLSDLGFKITHLPDGTVQVSAAGVSNVEWELNNLARNRTVNISVNAPMRAPSWVYKDNSANGNLFQGKVRQFANGGFASGGMPSGMYAGVVGGIRNGNHLFAEKHLGVPWELYLSGKASAKARNQRLLERAAPMLGMKVVPMGAERSTAAPLVQHSSTTERRGGDTTVTFVNPVSVDPVRDAQEAADLIGAQTDV